VTSEIAGGVLFVIAGIMVVIVFVIESERTETQ
jgi:hypothetical protein